MSFRYLSAPLILPGNSTFVENGVLVMDGPKVVEIINSGSIDPALLEHLDGALCPGFVNAHCHLELSHLKGQINKHTSLTGFIGEIVTRRNQFSDEQITAAAFEADREMWNSGIVAVGDICNAPITIPVKQNSKLHYHSFIELFDLNEKNAETVFRSGKELLKLFQSAELPATLSPHAPYSVSPSLMKMIFESKDSIPATIHAEENPAEKEMIKHNSGELAEFFHRIDPGYSSWAGKYSSPLAYVLSFKPKGSLQLVHNTFATEDEIAAITGTELFWCVCSRANEYIESSFPPVEVLDRLGLSVTIGTDSYASNDSLSVMDELLFISDHLPHLTVDKLITWASFSGARFLKIDKRFGSLEPGKTPGVNLIKNIDLNNKKLTKSSSVKKIC